VVVVVGQPLGWVLMVEGEEVVLLLELVGVFAEQPSRLLLDFCLHRHLRQII
jgi:hypothetical protein